MSSNIQKLNKSSKTENSKSKELIRELLSEFLGTFFMLTIIISVELQNKFDSENKCIKETITNEFGMAFGSTFAIFIGISSALAISGGHVNPVVTVTLGALGKFSRLKIVPYICSQLLGAYTGSAAAYLGHYPSVNLVEKSLNNTELTNCKSPPNIGDLFTSFPAQHMDLLDCFIDQLIATSLFMFGFMAIIDDKNAKVPKHVQPFYISLLIYVISVGYGKNTQNPFNPARDLGPRIFILIFDWGRTAFKPLDYSFWFVGGILGPLLGGFVGAVVYSIAIGAQIPTQPKATCDCVAIKKVNFRIKEPNLAEETESLSESISF